MFENGLNSLLTLSFLVFSLVAWQLTQRHKGNPRLIFLSGLTVILLALRVLIGHVDAPSGRPIVDGFLLLLVIALLTVAVVEIIYPALARDPSN